MEAMLEKVKGYASYSDTGEYYLDKIPAHWHVEKAKWLFSKKDRIAREEDEIVTCFRDGQVTLRKNRKTEGFTIALKEHGYQGIRVGDLVIHNMDAFAGAIGVSDSDGKSTPVYSVCVPRRQNEANPYFYAYFLRNLAKRGFIQSLAKGIRERSTDFRYNDFSLLTLPVPPLPEQNAIAQFLDTKTTLIDKAINTKERQIELLKERRDVLINKAVTKGLNPNVKMKDSGVEWIGEVPEHWEVKRLGSIGAFSKGGGFSRSDLSENGLSAILYGDIYTKYEIKAENVISRISTDSTKNAISIVKGSLLFTGSGETIDDIGKCIAFESNEITYAGGDVIIFRPKHNHSIFLSYSLNTNGAKWEKAKHAKGEIIVHTYASKLKDIRIPIPPIEEQAEISKYLDVMRGKVKNAIKIKQTEIEKLKEYKSSLINSAVTGKIKVC